MTEWVCANCKSINRPSARNCYSCGAAVGVVAPTTSEMATSTMPELSTTGGSAMAGMPLALGADGGTMPLIGEAVMPPPRPATPAGAMDVVGGLVGGIVAAVLASAVWYGVVAATQFQVGLVAIAVGWLVGQGVVFGAQRRFSIALIPISVVLTLVALATSEYLIVAHFVSQELGAPVDVLQSPAFVVEIVIASLQTDPLTLVFWAIALFQAFVIPARVPRPTGD